MFSDMPHVSVGLPVYNGERYLSESIECILKQSYRNFELIISDNGSTDQTQEICRGFTAKDPRVRFVRHEVNHGVNWNFRHVVGLARGKYFRWASADDLFAPDSLAWCVETLNNHAEVVLCYPKTVLIDGEGKVIRQYDDNLDLRFESPVERFCAASNRIGLVNVQYGLIRLDSLKKTAPLGCHPGADIVLVLELTLYGQFYEIPKPLFFRRMHEHASSSKKNKTDVWEQQFFNPTSKGHFFMRSWTHQYQHLASILRAPISFVSKAQLAAFLLRRTLSIRHTLMTEIKEAISRPFSSTKSGQS